jgi:hypothetical protein
MNRKSIVKSGFGLFAALCVALVFVVANVGVFSQNTNSSTTEQNTNTNMAPPDTSMAAAQDTSGGTNEDLSGTYAGRVRMSGGHEMNADGTLTITGNTFSIAAEGMTHNGRIYAVNTRRYIGAALIFEDLTDPVTSTPLACSVRARKGRTFSLTPVPGSRNRCWFTGRNTG